MSPRLIECHHSPRSHFITNYCTTFSIPQTLLLNHLLYEYFWCVLWINLFKHHILSPKSNIFQNAAVGYLNCCFGQKLRQENYYHCQKSMVFDATFALVTMVFNVFPSSNIGVNIDGIVTIDCSVLDRGETEIGWNIARGPFHI